jgi:hypothetical protein
VEALGRERSREVKTTILLGYVALACLAMLFVLAIVAGVRAAASSRCHLP